MSKPRVFLKPTLNVQQLGRACGQEVPEYAGCWELRCYVQGVDYADAERGELMGCVARRLLDKRILAAPDWRFCSKKDSYEVLWLQKRRHGDVHKPIHPGGASGEEGRSTAETGAGQHPQPR